MRKEAIKTAVLMLVAAASGGAVEPTLAVPPGNRFGPGGVGVPIVRPVVSPYLALGPGGLNRTITTYYTFVRPQLYQEQAIQQQGAAIRQLQHQLQPNGTPVYGQTGYGQPGTQPIRPTGYRSWYSQHQRYFGVGRPSDQ